MLLGRRRLRSRVSWNVIEDGVSLATSRSREDLAGRHRCLRDARTPGWHQGAILVLHGDGDQIVPIADSALLAVKILPKATLKIHPGLPHGMCTVNADTINADLLAFLKA